MLSHVRQVIEHLKDGGATDIEVEQNRHPKISWRVRDRSFRLSMAGTPSDRDNAISNAKQDIRRMYRAAGVQA